MSDYPFCFRCGIRSSDLHYADVGHGPVHMHDSIDDCLDALRAENELLASNLKQAESYIDTLLADFTSTED